MSQVTAIEWTDLSWNPVHGCSKVSPGCANCYAETLSRRYGHTKAPWTPSNAEANVLLKPHKMREPLSNSRDWQGLGAAAAAAGKTDGKLVFVNSTSDLFHEQVPDDFIAEVFAVMAKASRHTFQVLTKRPDRARDLLRDDVFAGAARLFADEWLEVPWPLPNVWIGTSIENRRFVHRADTLRDTPAAVRFISAEPLLGPLLMGEGRSARRRIWPDGYVGPQLDLTGIDWLIVGGESGARARRMDLQWVRDLRDECTRELCRRARNDTPVRCNPAFFFKQVGGRTSKIGGRALDGRTWSEFPIQAFNDTAVAS